MSSVPSPQSTRPNLALVGATGRFAESVIGRLALRDDEWGEIRLLSPRDTTRTLPIRGREEPIRVLGPGAFDGIDVALGNLSTQDSPEWMPRAVAAGATVVDASATYRHDDDVPLVVPGINDERVRDRPKGIVALPGPVTWALIDAAHVLHLGWELQQLVVTGLIAADSRADGGVERLRAEIGHLAQRPRVGMGAGDIRAALSDLPEESPFMAPLAMNVIPWVGRPTADGWTTTELGVADEVRKVLEIPHVPVVATLVQVPVVSGHSMAIHARCARPVHVDKVRQALIAAPSLVALDERYGEVPTPVDVVGTDPRFVGRVRQPEGLGHQVDLFLSADTMRRGADAMLTVAGLVAAER